ncbi:MAG: flavodoxin-dependent (E)-4-hydroxy-3-methylbut-2-enyl-diphosphate synthase [Clostridiaceae bacterium]|nr:flavodoxin-dependent (E)-4-hydroxy-3-methylbut-2-enyl-diphosphate synthase [Clostridiaceae bacterium]
MIERKIKKVIKIGKERIGGSHPVLIQSMTNTDTKDIAATVSQIRKLEAAGCKAVRIAVPDQESADAFGEIKKQVDIPLIADIHFDYRLAISAIKNGADKIRINPGNIGGEEKVKRIADTAGQYGIPIRIGVNSGSLEKDLLKKYGHVTAEALVESLGRYVTMMEGLGFFDLVLSIKASDVVMNKKANEYASAQFEYPLHLGVTEAGTFLSASVKSAVGIGSLLLQGIGDTIRVSIAGNPVREIEVAKEILNACGFMESGLDIVACPTCARTNINVEEIVDYLKQRSYDTKRKIKVAVMGCEVNGPGEAKEADIGIAGGKKDALLFFKGKPAFKVEYDKIKEVLDREILKLIDQGD